MTSTRDIRFSVSFPDFIQHVDSLLQFMSRSIRRSLELIWLKCCISYLTFLCVPGHTMAQLAGRRPFTAEARGRS